MGGMPKDYSKLAERQAGVITFQQLQDCGFSKDGVRRRIAKRLLHPLHRRVYAVAGVPDSFERRITAAVLAAGPGAVASHRAAAALHALGEVQPRVEISVPSARRPRLDGVEVHRHTRLPDSHLIWRGRIRITTRARTICDLAAVLSAKELELVLDHALARRRVTVKDVKETLDELPENAKGAGELRGLLAARSNGRARVESPLEQQLQDIVKRARLDGADPQHQAAGCRIDVAFPREMLAVQMDSYLYHSSRTDWVRDHGRHGRLVEAGWRVLPVTKEDLEDEPRLVERISRALRPGER
ncbi:MAG: hypothetical protein ACAI25_20920 [Planctomycetota bacterium]